MRTTEGQMSSQVPANSNRICITICEWRLKKINSVFSFNVNLMGCCYTNHHIFQTGSASQKEIASQICYFLQKISYLSWYYSYVCSFFRELFDHLECFMLDIIPSDWVISSEKSLCLRMASSLCVCGCPSRKFQ